MPDEKPNIRLRGLFWSFAKMGAVLIGGGYALLPLFSGITELLARCIMAALSGHTHRFLFAIACDPAAWCAAGLYTLLAYLFVRHQWKRQGVLDQ